MTRTHEEEQRRILLQQRAIDSLRERIVETSYLTLQQVMERTGLGRTYLEQLPPEILPYTPHRRGPRVHRRYHPADVLALDAMVRRWDRAKQRGEENAFIEAMGRELEARDALAIDLARGRP